MSLYTTVLSQATVTTHYQLGGAPVRRHRGPDRWVGRRHRTGRAPARGTPPSTTLSLVLATGTDPSGIATTGNQLLRATASLTDGTCGTFGSYAVVATDPTSPAADAVADAACYRYQYVVNDTLGNPTTYTSPDIKVDVTAPAAPSLAFSHADQRLVAGQRPDGLLPVRRRLRLAPRHRRGDRAVRHRRLRVPGAGQRLDGDPGRDRRDDVLVERGEPGGPRHQDGDRDQQRRRRPPRPRRSRSPRTTPRRPGDAITYADATTTSTTRQRHPHHRHRRRLGDRHPAPAARVGDADRQHLRRVRRLHDGRRTNPTSPVVDTVTGGVLLPVPVRRRGQRRQHGHRDRDQRRQGHPDRTPPRSTPPPGCSTGGGWVRRRRRPPRPTARAATPAPTRTAPTVGAAGAIAGDANTAVQLDGVNDYVTAARTVSDQLLDRVLVQVDARASAPAPPGSSGAGLVNADVAGTDQRLRRLAALRRQDRRRDRQPRRLDRVDARAATTTAAGTTSCSPGSGRTGALALYVDGAAAGTATGRTQALITRPRRSPSAGSRAGTQLPAGHARRGRALQRRAQRGHGDRALHDRDDSVATLGPCRWRRVRRPGRPRAPIGGMTRRTEPESRIRSNAS